MGVLSQVHASARVRPTIPMVRLDLFSSLTTLAPYTVIAAAAALAAFVLQNHVHRIQEDALLVLGDPFAIPLYGGTLLIAVYLAASAAMAVAREREFGAVELLSYGPVSTFLYLLAKLISHVLLCALLLAMLLGAYLLLSRMTGLQLRSSTVSAMALSVGPVAAATTLGLLVAALVRRVRPTVLVVLALAMGAVGLQVAREILVRVPTPEFHVSPVTVLQWATFAISSITQWVLPFGYMDRELSAVLRGDLVGALVISIAAGVYALVVLPLAAVALDRTGLRR